MPVNETDPTTDERLQRMATLIKRELKDELTVITQNPPEKCDNPRHSTQIDESDFKSESLTDRPDIVKKNKAARKQAKLYRAGVQVGDRGRELPKARPAAVFDLIAKQAFAEGWDSRDNETLVEWHMGTGQGYKPSKHMIEKPLPSDLENIRIAEQAEISEFENRLQIFRDLDLYTEGTKLVEDLAKLGVHRPTAEEIAQYDADLFY